MKTAHADNVQTIKTHRNSMTEVITVLKGRKKQLIDEINNPELPKATLTRLDPTNAKESNSFSIKTIFNGLFDKKNKKKMIPLDRTVSEQIGDDQLGGEFPNYQENTTLRSLN